MHKLARLFFPFLSFLGCILLVLADEDSNPCTHSWGESYYDCTVSINGPSSALVYLCREIPAASGGNSTVRSRVQSSVSTSGRCRHLRQCDLCGTVDVLSDNPAPTEISVSGPEIPADPRFPSLLQPGTYYFTATVHCHTDYSCYVEVVLNDHNVCLNTGSRTTLPCVLSARIPLSGTWENGLLPVQSVTVPMNWPIQAHVEWPRLNAANLPPVHQGSGGCDDLTGHRCVNAGCAAQGALSESDYAHLTHGEQWRAGNLPPDAGEGASLPESAWSSAGALSDYLTPDLPGEWKMVFEKRCVPAAYANGYCWPRWFDTATVTTAQCGDAACGGHFEYSVTAVGVDSLEAEAENGATLTAASGEEILLVACEVSEETAVADDRVARAATPVQLTAEPTNEGPWPSDHPLYGNVPDAQLNASQLIDKQLYHYPKWYVEAPYYCLRNRDWILGYEDVVGEFETDANLVDGNASVELLAKTPGFYRIYALCGEGAYSEKSRLVASCDVRLHVDNPALKYLMLNDDYDFDLSIPDGTAIAGWLGEGQAYTVNGTLAEDDLRTIHLNFALGDGWETSEMQSALADVRLRLEALSGGEKVRIWKNGVPLNVASSHVSLPADFIPGQLPAWQGGPEHLPSALKVEGVAAGTVTLRLSVLVGETVVAHEDLTLTVVRTGLVPDHNRDHKIDETDRDNLANPNYHRLRFWTSTDLHDLDNSSGYLVNLGYAKVDGVQTLIDFFPLWLDVANWPETIEDEEVQYELSASGNLYVVLSDLAPGHAGDYNTTPAEIYGTALSKLASEAETEQAAGLVFSDATHHDFFEAMKAGDGVLLCEAVEVYQTTTMSLELEVHSGNLRIGGWQLPLSISPVGQMYRSVNLRNGPLAQTTLQDLTANAPTNLPDAEMADCEVFFAHGFRVTEGGASEWNDTVFKRLWQSGMDARFWGVDWEGDEGLVANGGLNYHGNVVNAFMTAPWYAALLDYVKDNRDQTPCIVVMAHSLGNMLTSSAIVDCHAQVNAYLMCNAAVPTEAYDGATHNTSSTSSNKMVHDEWREYDSQTWSAEWHSLFVGDMVNGEPDMRQKDTWENRFQSMLSNVTCYNFFSVEDEVFQLADSTPSWNTGIMSGLSQYSWQKQEFNKGHWNTYAGWGFRKKVILSSDPEEYEIVNFYTSPEANALTTAELKDSTKTVFRFCPITLDKSDSTLAERNELLAYAIPALSAAAGHEVIPSNNTRCVNLLGCKRNTLTLPWEHSAMKDLAYFYVFRFYERAKDIIHNTSQSPASAGGN